MARDINQVTLVGRLTRECELKYTSGGMAICNFSVAVNRRKRSGEQWVDEVDFFDVSYFGKAAEAVSKYLTKGKQVALQGELRQDRWEKDGQRHSKVNVVANNVQLLGGGVGEGSEQRASGTARGGQSAPKSEGIPSSDFEDDIPF